MSTAASTFAHWAKGLGAEHLPETTIWAAKRHLLDGFGCAVAAMRSDAAPFATALVDGINEATVIGTRQRASVPRAALANGVLVHALDFDDTHADALVHATAAVLPTALAVGQKVQASGLQMLVAAVAGYEVVTRIGAAVTHGFHAQGFHATSVCGVFAASLVACKLMGADAGVIANALGIAGSAAAGSLEFLNSASSTKQLHPGLSAMNGIVAARLAMAGAEGPDSIFEGRYGLFRAYLDAKVDAEALTSGLGATWETERITIKPYPACQLSHASLDALAQIGTLTPEDVDSITVQLPASISSIVGSKPKPRTEYEAKFSIEHCLASLVVDGALTIDSFDADAVARASELAARVRWQDRPFEGPPADAPGICKVVLKDGAVLTGEVRNSKGGPKRPLDDSALRKKFVTNGGSAEQADRWLSLESIACVDEVFVS